MLVGDAVRRSLSAFASAVPTVAERQLLYAPRALGHGRQRLKPIRALRRDGMPEGMP